MNSVPWKSRLVGAVPDRFHWSGEQVDLATYFTMARGNAPGGPVPSSHRLDATCSVGAERRSARDGCGHGEAVALEMTKWFDTNYHYLVPELREGETFRLASTKLFDEFTEALALGIRTVPVPIGPITFLLLAKTRGVDFDRLSLLPALLPVYAEVLRRLQHLGGEWMQLDEPVLCLDLSLAHQAAFAAAYNQLRDAAPGLKLLLTTYFGDLRDNLATACQLPVDALHLDAVRAPQELDHLLAQLPPNVHLSLGVVDGRNVWRNDFQASLKLLRKAAAVIGYDRLMVSSSCSLLHAPLSLRHESKLDAELKSWLAFAEEKLTDVGLLAALVHQTGDSAALVENRAAIASRRNSPCIHDNAVKRLTAAISEAELRRASPFLDRRARQQARLNLPLLPTTTTGSFPQTEDVRAARARFKKGELSRADYEAFLEQKTAECVRWQEEAGLDVLVHGEFAQFRYPNDIGPGVWDIHSPRVPSAEEMLGLIRAAAKVIPAERLWVNPDCGLKTRRWEEVKPALGNLVAAACTARKS